MFNLRDADDAQESAECVLCGRDFSEDQGDVGSGICDRCDPDEDQDEDEQP